jgi:hypothetical protein
MKREEFEKIVNYIVDEGERVKRKYLKEETGPVDYVGIFCRDEKEKQKLFTLIKTLGIVVQETPTGPNFKLKTPILTKSGSTHFIKIRNTDPIKHQRGAPDFLVEDYYSFKKKYLGRKDFNLINREIFEMIEIWDPDADVLVYFKNITMAQVLGVKN